MNRRKIRSKKIIQPKKNIFPQVVFISATFIFFSLILYLLFFSQLLMVKTINIQGNKDLKKSIILEKIQTVLNGKQLGIFKKNNLLLIKKQKITDYLLTNFKQIRNVQVIKIFPTELEIKINERKPTLIICSDNNCYLLDEKGQAYANFNYSTKNKNSQLPILADQSNQNNKIGEYVLTKDYLNYILEIKNELFKEVGIRISYPIKTFSLVSGDIRVTTQAGWKIYFNREINLTKEIGMLRLVLNNEISEQQRKDLDYIDLRVDNKVFYKFRDGTPEEVARQKAIEEATQVTNQNAPASVLSVPSAKSKKK